METYETYAAKLRAQQVTPLTREQWIAELERAKAHTTDFEVTATDAELAPGRYRNYFGENHELLFTIRIWPNGEEYGDPIAPPVTL